MYISGNGNTVIIGNNNVSINSNQLSSLDNIRTLIGNAKTNQALDIFIQWANTNNSDLINDLIGLKSQFSSLKRNENLGLISYSEANIKRAQISNGILSLLETLKCNNFNHQKELNNQTMEFSIVSLNRFLKEFKEGLYPKSGNTMDLIIQWSNQALADCKRHFADDLEIVEDMLQVWELAINRCKSRNWNDVNELVGFLTDYSYSKNESFEVSSTMSEQEQLLHEAKNANHNEAIEKISKYINYKLTKLVGNDKKQLEIDWNTDKVSKQLDNMFTKAIYIKSLKNKYLA